MNPEVGQIVSDLREEHRLATAVGGLVLIGFTAMVADKVRTVFLDANRCHCRA